MSPCELVTKPQIFNINRVCWPHSYKIRQKCVKRSYPVGNRPLYFPLIRTEKIVQKTEVKNDLEFYEENADNWWDENAKIYALYHLNKPRFEFFDRHATNWQGLKTLDVGCGGGFSCEFMADRGAIVSGE